MSKKPTQPQDKYVLRLPDGLRDRIKAAADRNNRSMNAEIVQVLEREYPAPQSLAARLNEIIELVVELRETVADPAVDEVILSLDETLRSIAAGEVVDVSDDVREAIRARRSEWEHERPHVPSAEEYTDVELNRIQRREAFGKKRK